MIKFVKIINFVFLTNDFFVNMEFSEARYEELVGKLFVRFPSFQKVGAGAYKPGTGNMELFDSLAGHPHRKYKVIHVAGTNGKGSVSNMLASVLASSGLKVGLYTSPHIVDFRERMRSVEEIGGEMKVELVPKEYVWDFVNEWQETFDHFDMSFFEITTSIALSWFAHAGVDVVVLETGLGGRLDSTNIVNPILCVITNIGLDHCDMLGDTLPEIAFEKAGIIKPKVPVVVGESHPEINEVFERKVLYTNLSEPCFMGNRQAIMSLLTFADKVEPTLWERHEEILAEMDLQGEYQRKNLRTVLAALDVLGGTGLRIPHQVRDDVGEVTRGDVGEVTRGDVGEVTRDDVGEVTRGDVGEVTRDDVGEVTRGDVGEVTQDDVRNALIHTALRMDFHGRWEKLSDEPYVICDIGHNEHGLKYNFAQLSKMKAEGKCSDLIIVYGSVADKDVDAVIHLMPEDAHYIFTQAHGKRALEADAIRDKYLEFCKLEGRSADNVHLMPSVPAAIDMAYKLAHPMKLPLIYIGGSTYVVSEAVMKFRS